MDEEKQLIDKNKFQELIALVIQTFSPSSVIENEAKAEFIREKLRAEKKLDQFQDL